MAGTDLSAHTAELQVLVRSGPTAESDVALKVVENAIKSLWGKLERKRVDFVRAVALAGIDHPRIEVRKPAFYRLAELGRVLSSKSCFEEWLGPEVLDACQRGLSDPGTDWDEHGLPLQDKGTLTLADKSRDVLGGLGKQARCHRTFYGALQGLDRVNGIMACGRLQPGYGRKLMDKLLDDFERLLCSDSPMPLAALTPALFPNYLTEFLNVAASTEYRHVPLEPMMALVRRLPRAKPYLWHMVEVVRQDEYPHLIDMLWAHIANEMRDGHFAAELKHGLRKSLEDGHLPRERVPEELREVLFKHLDGRNPGRDSASNLGLEPR